MQDQFLLQVEDLRVHFYLREGVVRAVDGIDFAIKPRMTLGLVGESGSGKSVTAYALLHAVSRPGKIVSGRVLLRQGAEDGLGQSEVTDLATLDPLWAEDSRDSR